MSYAYDYHSLLYKTASSATATLQSKEEQRRIPYATLLEDMRNIITRDHPELIREVFHEAGQQEARTLIKKEVHRQHVIVADEGTDKLNTLVDQIYDDLFGFGILTQYIYDENVQEINGNRWDDVEIITADGYFKLAEKFTGPRQAQAVVRRMAQLGGVTVDGSTPDGDSYITEGVRIHVKVPPIIDEKAAVQFSIRKQRREVFTREEFISRDTATPLELDFLSLALSHGVSIGIAGSAGSGKTTDVNYLLSTMPSSLRIYVIEEAREIQLEQQNTDGTYISRVMHTKTRHDLNAAYNIDARRLVRDALWCDPDIIVPAEMRGAEALDVMEAGRTGHTIISTFHAQGNEDAYKRIASMAMMAGAGYSENMLLSFAYASFPLMVYKVQLADGTRKYVEIAEARRDSASDEYKVVPLFQFIPTGRDEHGRITGRHEKVNNISESLANRMRLKGATKEELKPFVDK